LPFSFEQVKYLLPQLLKFWPNLYINTPLDSFWQHEWDKHGTCALGTAYVKNESDYFTFTLALRNQFDFGPILEKSGIEPDDTFLYDLSKLKQAVQKVLNVEPYAVCYVLRDSDVQYLSQMNICFDKQMQLIECSRETLEIVKVDSDNEPQEIECQSGLPVHYPTIRRSPNVK
jgi:ribonuclease T2